MGLLLYKGRVYVPEDAALRAEIRMLCHDDRLAGHFGVEKTLALAKRDFYWPEMNDDLERCVETCALCQFNKSKRHKPYGELKPLPVPEDVWQEVSLDFITGLLECRHGDSVFDSILVIVDRFSKMVLYEPAKITWQATDFADAFFRRVISRFGPKRALSRIVDPFSPANSGRRCAQQCI
jgi:hypothetical protein